MFKPVLPLIQDIWDHEFNEIEHVATIHAKYGVHHLQKQIGEASEGHEKNQNGLKAEDQPNVHLGAETKKLDILKERTHHRYSHYYSVALLSGTLSISAPPPKF